MSVNSLGHKRWHVRMYRIRTATFRKRMAYMIGERDKLISEIKFKQDELRRVQNKIMAFERAISNREEKITK